MGVALFFLLAVGIAGIILVPLLPGRTVARSGRAVTDKDIEQAVLRLQGAAAPGPCGVSGRRSEAEGNQTCPSCGRAYQAEDRFCVRCGAVLPDPKLAAVAVAVGCPSCGAPLREGDQFCGKCGYRVAPGEVA